jgi:hypothetical protein
MYGTSILIVRSRSASMNSFDWSFRYSGSFVWPRITSSIAVCANFLRLDHVLLRRAEQIVEERDVELEDLDELDEPAVRDAELAVEVERARVGVGSELGDLPVVDVARELGRVLVLLVLRLERADADAVALAEDEPAHADALDELRPVAADVLHGLAVEVAAHRIEVALEADRVVVLRAGLGLAVVAGDPRLVDLAEHLVAQVERNELERLLVERRVDDRAVGKVPGEREEPSLGLLRVPLEALLEEPGNRRLSRNRRGRAAGSRVARRRS